MPSRPSSVRSGSRADAEASERSPLLPQNQENAAYNTVPEEEAQPPSEERSQRSHLQQQWPFIAGLVAFCIALLAVIVTGSVVPSATQTFIKDAAVVDISGISIESFTEQGALVRVDTNVRIDGSRVRSGTTRLLGRIGTGIVRTVRLDGFTANVYLPKYNNALLGSARLPAMRVGVRDGYFNRLSLLAKVQPGPLETIHDLAQDYLAGNLRSLKLRAEADVTVRKGIFAIKPGTIMEQRVIKDFPALPQFEVTKLLVYEVNRHSTKVVMANVTALVENAYPFAFTIPPLGFQVALAGCEADSRLPAAIARTSEVNVKPRTPIKIEASGLIVSLAGNLTAVCTGTNLSPIDAFLGNYLHGEEATVYISGDGSNDEGKTPAWLVELLQSFTIPVPFPGHTFDNVIKSFGLSHVNIKLPGGPDNPSTTPLLSATVEALVRTPKEMDLPLNITKIMATANVSYESENFGVLDTQKWIPTVSELIPSEHLLRVKGIITDAPLNITDYNVFQKVVRKLLFGGKGVQLGIDGNADASLETALGEFVVHKIPAAGNITIDGFPGLGSMPKPTLKDIIVDSTTETSMNLKIVVLVENPTPYEASIPYANVLIDASGYILGNGTVRNQHVTLGNNTIVVEAAWDPRGYSGAAGVKAGEELMSNFISGRNTSITLQTHENSFPTMPQLGKSLSTIHISLPTPNLGGPDSGPFQFIQSATMHLVTSAADFLIRNPLPHNSVIIKVIDGIALYNDSTVGTINYNNMFLIHPGKDGSTLTPRLPVAWEPGSVGYEAVRKALWGELQLKARASCSLGVGNFEMRVFYNGSRPIGAHVRW